MNDHTAHVFFLGFFGGQTWGWAVTYLMDKPSTLLGLAVSLLTFAWYVRGMSRSAANRN